MKLYQVIFKKGWYLYNAGEKASFPLEKAERLCRDGLAVPAEKKEQVSPAPQAGAGKPSNRSVKKAPVRK